MRACRNGANVAFSLAACGLLRWPGIVKASIALPDVHSGYGFAIGNVAAFDMSDPESIVSPGACVRLHVARDSADDDRNCVRRRCWFRYQLRRAPAAHEPRRVGRHGGAQPLQRAETCSTWR